ncbi:MAG: glycosyltransferase [Oscillospiraceae bacterium]|jgi:glycosyltransferase involved in cell wall biosynthesis|nr:glycosyltransferase [Oscillospiraceae bacterium]
MKHLRSGAAATEPQSGSSGEAGLPASRTLKMLNVLNVITDTNIGGAGLVLVNYYRRADRERFAHAAVVPEGSRLAPRLRALGIETVELPGIADRSFDRGSIDIFLRLFRERKPDIVHTHASLSARIAARRYGKCGIVHTRHCAYTLPKRSKSFPLKQISGFINNRYSDAVIAVSPSAAKNLTDLGADPRKITVMMNGAERVRSLTAEERAAARLRFGIGFGDFVCAMAARFSPEKGHRVALDAAERLSGGTVTFLFAGDGAIFEEIKAEAARRGLTNCLFPGFEEDVAEVYGAADVVLNCSTDSETSSLAIIEAMSAGLAVVASDVCGNPVLLGGGECGILVPPGDGAALADAITRLEGDRVLLAQLGGEAERRYSARYTAEIMARNIENVYGKAAGGRAADRN